MARIRTIKPEFPHSESMGRVSREARLCFMLMWTIADDAGRLRGNSRMLASLLYPYDDDAGDLIEAWLADLDRERCINRYEVDGCQYIEIRNWLKHQKIDKPSKSKIPEFVESSRILAGESRTFVGGLEGIEGSGSGPIPTRGRESRRVANPREESAKDSRGTGGTGENSGTLRAPDAESGAGSGFDERPFRDLSPAEQAVALQRGFDKQRRIAEQFGFRGPLAGETLDCYRAKVAEAQQHGTGKPLAVVAALAAEKRA